MCCLLGSLSIVKIQITQVSVEQEVYIEHQDLKTRLIQHKERSVTRLEIGIKNKKITFDI
jgi:hypothetical protein